jgi:CRISPR-associated protein (TIGR03986 family)
MQDRGFGFIQPETRGPDVWFHASKVRGSVPFERLQVGMRVQYEVQQGERGPQARFVQPLDEPPPASPAGRPAKPYRFLNPYNFVRFLNPPDGRKTVSPELALLGRLAPPPHDRYVGLSGTIHCSLEAVTPLFVSDSEGVKTHGEHRSYEFFKLGGNPALPASSLRGMVRGVFEAVSNSCLRTLKDARLSYHLPPAEALKLVPGVVGQDWRLRVLTGMTEWQPGRRPQGAQYAAWMLRYLPPLRRSRNAPSDTPYGRRRVVDLQGLGHGRRCWAILRRIKHPQRNFEFWNVEQVAAQRNDLRPSQGEERVAEGYLCITNQNIENKHDERFFFHGNGIDRAPALPLEPHVLADYNALIRDYQERHRDAVQKRRKRRENAEERSGEEPAFSRFIVHEEAAELRPGDVVYAMISERRQVEYLVPVSVPRVAFRRSIAGLLPDNRLPEGQKYLAPCSKADCLCPACRVFGWVADKEGEGKKDLTRRLAWKGRLTFSHGTLVHSAGTLPPTPLAILSSPKPTTVRFYLKGAGDGEPDADRGYDGPGNELRGRKVYRHHGKAREEEYRRAGGRCDDQNRTVRDALLPGARFTFTVRFENLAAVELGALLWSLDMDQRGCHRLGFGKPLGFGSVAVRVEQVRTLDPGRRYRSLRDDGWQEAADWRERYVARFKVALAERYGVTEFEALANVQDLRALLGEPPDGLPVHYPRSGRQPDPEGKNFEWFMANNRHRGVALDRPTEDRGLPLLTRDGVEVP